MTKFFHLISFSCGPSSSGEMVSRRKILSRSRDDLHLDGGAHNPGEPEEEDIWYNKEKLYKVSKKLTAKVPWLCRQLKSFLRSIQYDVFKTSHYTQIQTQPSQRANGRKGD